MNLDKTYRILVINPGSTSTKVAVYENEKELFSENAVHSQEKLQEYGCTEALNLDGGDTVALAFNNKVILHGNMESKNLRNLGSMIAFGLKDEPAAEE